MKMGKEGFVGGEGGDCSIQCCQRSANSCWPHICCALSPGLYGDETQPWLARGKPVIGASALCRLWGPEPNAAPTAGWVSPLLLWFPSKHEKQAPCKSIWASSPRLGVTSYHELWAQSLFSADSSSLSSSGCCPSPIASYSFFLSMFWFFSFCYAAVNNW